MFPDWGVIYGYEIYETSGAISGDLNALFFYRLEYIFSEIIQ
jgi:hypothetical protein